ncbi:unnamed protein product [Kuraishia capsulata CBS 1993]|uniref:Altered inheritance of mitochondria protein 21 n=1 Tax=Kuraishia capsulata CBS 1993 TaxID=1382522 RepID=W6MKE2_9ASCO|nr:uncharacterized protein KUCA_T00002435001 [Kuraishia capsulata CBS 1993]CDK26463.1 unnamed protein product [Kuraishia capsulata CBS 1993]
MKPKTSEKKEVTPEIPLRPSFEPTEKDATPEVPSRPSLEPDASKEKDATPEVPSRPSIGPEISDKKEVTPEISLRPSLEPEGSENKEVTSEVLSRPNVEPSEKEVTPPVPSRPNLQSVGSEEEEIPELPNQIEASEEIDSPVSDALTKTDSATETSIPTPQISTRPTIDGIPAETSTKTESESVEKSEEAEAKGILGASEEILSKSTREAAILERPVANEELAIPEKPVLDAKSATSESSITSTAPAPALPPVPRRLTDGSLSDASSETITKKPPPKVPKKPSSRIAAFQQMFAQQEAPAPVPRKIPPRPKPKSTESSGAESLEIFSADSPTSQPQITSRFTGAKADFAKNLNGMIGFGLPGMVPMPGMAMPVPTRADEADDTDQEKATVAKPNDVRKSRARGPKGRSLPKTVKVAVEDDSNKSRYEIFVSEVWRFETETEEQTNESTENPEKELEKENEKETGAEYVTIVTSKAAEEYAAEDIHEETTKTTQQEELVIPDKTEILPSSSSKPTEISAEVIPEAVPEVVTGADTENLVEASRAAIEDSDPVLASVADDQPQPDEAESEDLGEGVKPIEKTVDEPLEESEKTATRSEGESKDPVSPLDPTAEDPTVAEDNDQPN